MPRVLSSRVLPCRTIRDHLQAPLSGLLLQVLESGRNDGLPAEGGQRVWHQDDGE